MNENDRTDDILLWTRLVLSLAQLVVALSVIGLIVAPPLTNGLNRLKTEIWGRSITLEATVTDRQGNPVSNVTVTVVRNDGTPYKDSVGNPARSVTDKNGRCMNKTLCLIVISQRLIIIIALETPKYIGETSLNAGVLILAIKNPANKITLDITKQ